MMTDDAAASKTAELPDVAKPGFFFNARPQ
jgi:hypothetical protein